jgi:hypothetical protein
MGFGRVYSVYQNLRILPCYQLRRSTDELSMEADRRSNFQAKLLRTHIGLKDGASSAAATMTGESSYVVGHFSKFVYFVIDPPPDQINPSI